MAHRHETLNKRIGDFLRKYGRKRSPGHNANDRPYDRELEKRLKRMDPEELDQVLQGEQPDETDDKKQS